MIFCTAIIIGTNVIDQFNNYNSEDLSAVLGDGGDYGIPHVDAETYFEEQAEVVTVIDAAKSESVHTEKQAAAELKDRGFSTYPIYSNYSINGIFYPNTEISSSSSERHPLFTTYYNSSAGEYWTIYDVNGVVMAYPISYNLQSQAGLQLIVSESEVLTSYDSESNQFYMIVPDRNSFIIITVDRIDAGSLDELTIDTIDSM